jgi:transcriptional regulator with XRE-family HTH domain
MSASFDAMALRHARLAQNLSQAELARQVGVSQASISYYERERVVPPYEVRLQLQRVLGLPAEAFELWARPEEPSAARPLLLPARERWLGTLERFVEEVAWLDRPAGRDGGDLALAVDRGSHALLAVLDATGQGEQAAMVARVLAGVALGAMSAGEGMPWPEDVVEAVHKAARGLLDEEAAITVLSLERRSRRLRLCRLGAPPPLLRSGSVGPWPGLPEGPAGSYVGERQLEPQSLIVLGTDGASELPTRAKGHRGLWESPDFRTVLARARHPEQVVAAARDRYAEAPSAADDLLLVAACVGGP